MHKLRRNLRAKGYHDNKYGLPTHSLASSDDAGSPTDEGSGDGGEGGQGADGGDDGEEDGEKAAKKEGEEETPKLPEFRKMRVCDGLGCHTQVCVCGWVTPVGWGG